MQTGTLTSDEMILRGVRLGSSGGGSGAGASKILCADGTDAGSNDDLTVPKTESAVDIIDGNVEEGSCTQEIPLETLRVMVACHGLATQPSPKTHGMTKEVIGDPLEKAVLDGCGWQLVRENTVSPPLPSGPNDLQNRPKPIRIAHRYAFTSKLRRMSVLATEMIYNGGSAPSGSSDVWVLTKGAPETIKSLLKPDSIPSNYDQVARYHMRCGQRVLALAYRKTGIPPNLINQLKEKERSQIERDLVFAGLLVLDCPLKPDSRRVIKELRSTGHQCKMITGDAALTATEVAKQVGMVGSGHKKLKRGEKAVVMYEMKEMRADNSFSGGFGSKDDEGGEDVPLASSSEFVFVPLDDDQSVTKNTIAYVSSNLRTIEAMVQKSEIAVCVTGDILNKIAIDAINAKRSKRGQEVYLDPKTVLLHPAAQAVLQKLVPLVSVFARHAPRQKEAVIAALNGNGSITLMCGDGTNDVGALKMAHVGISIVSVPDLEAKQREALEGISSAKDDKKASKKKTKMKSSSKRKKKSLEESLRALAEAEEELNFVALGDASVASPFTSRTMSIKCTKDILQRGRCTLVTMLQIYKILGVNCLVNALVLTRLHMVGVKQGDRQLTVVGLVIAALFYFVTRGQPLSTLSPKRPPSSVLCKSTLISIAAQFAVHFLCIMAVTHLSSLHLDPDDPSLVPDGPFNPNVLNTATFLVTVLATVNTFVVNYTGRPYMQNLTENKLMLRSVQISYVALFACALETFPPLNELMQLTPLPADGAEIFAVAGGSGFGEQLSTVVESIGFKLTLCLCMVIDTAMAYQAEMIVQRIFGN
jgi:cation-transporting ATPase 13A1